MLPDSPSDAGVEASLGASRADIVALFLRLLPPEFFTQLRRQQQLRRQNNRIYTDGVVIWLMVLQRLLANGSLETAVLELLRGLPRDFWPRLCKRLQAGQNQESDPLSGNTGSYNQARQELPLTIVEQSADRTFRQLMEQVGQEPGSAPGAAPGRAAFS